MAATLPARGRVTGGTVGAVTVDPPTRLPRSLPAMELASDGAGADSTLPPMPPPAAASAEAMGSTPPIAPTYPSNQQGKVIRSKLCNDLRH